MNKEEFLKKLEIELKIGKNSKHTLKNYLRMNSLLLNYFDQNPEEISENEIKEYIAENLSEKSAISIIMFLSAIKFAYTSILKKDPTQNIRRPKKEKKLPSVLTKEEVFKLMESIPSKKSRLMISLIYATGLRVSELTSLEIKHLDFEEKIGKIIK